MTRPAESARPPRTAAVVTNLRCNQACVYCTSRSATDDRAFIRPEAVRARIAAGIAAGSREIVLTGGEPSMRGDLEALVAFARGAGAEAVSLETNGTLLDAERARALRDAGLTTARVNLVGGDARVDEVTRDPGGFAKTLAGLAALGAAGIAIEILVAVVRATRELVPTLPDTLADALADAGVPVRAIEIAVPTVAPDPGELLAFDEAATVILALEARARARGIAVRMGKGSGVPPCVFPPKSRSRTAHLYAMTAGAGAASAHASHRHVAACDPCLVRDRCPGLPDAYLARRPPPPMHPVREERVRRRLTVLTTVQEQIARELVTQSLYADEAGNPAYDAIVRVNFHCNQACTFCFVSTHLPPAADAAIEAAIREAGARGSRIVISGGEPTLNPRVVEYVHLARGVSDKGISLQTNAIRLDDARLVAALVEAGMNDAFVSLHGATAAISDTVTEAPGTFARTVAGIDNLVKSPARVTLNFVLCEANRRELPAFVRFVAARWPRALVNVSFVAASTDLVPKDRALVPRYADAMPALEEAVAIAEELGVKLTGFESMCGLPLCLVPPRVRDLALTPIPEGFDQGEFLKVDACRGCRYEATCFGVRRGYAELYGTGELTRVPLARR